MKFNCVFFFLQRLVLFTHRYNSHNFQNAPWNPVSGLVWFAITENSLCAFLFLVSHFSLRNQKIKQKLVTLIFLTDLRYILQSWCRILLLRRAKENFQHFLMFSTLSLMTGYNCVCLHSRATAKREIDELRAKSMGNENRSVCCDVISFLLSYRFLLYTNVCSANSPPDFKILAQTWEEERFERKPLFQQNKAFSCF